MMLLKQNESNAARREVLAVMLDTADYATPRTGLTVTATILKAGSSAFAAIAGSVAEVGATGVYRVGLAAADLDTAGPAMLSLSAAGAVTQYLRLEVVALDLFAPPDAESLGLGELHLVKAVLANKRTHRIETGVNTVYDDDGETPLLTLTPDERDGVVTITPA